ncbi:hypothetical protein MYX82_10305 [Acidobacteria bacterium AH-259-D05]|nr:hypothetical protein [Acidobacteria bacterium AH-259-D05]
MKVFILGSGASHGADRRLPLIEEFFDSSLYEDDAVESGYGSNNSELPPFQFNVLRQFLNWHFLRDCEEPQDRQLQITPNRLKINVEEVFIHLEYLRGETSYDNPLYGELLSGRSQLLDFISRRLRFKQEGNFQKYSEMLNHVNPEDSILSFNWDVLLDQALHQYPFREKLNRYFMNQAALFRPQGSWSADNPGYYLKMHGSLHWYACINSRCQAEEAILRDSLVEAAESSPDLTYDHLPKLKSWPRCPRCGEALKQAIVPPAAEKIDLMPVPIRAQWKIAYHVLQEASEWIFIGYSIPHLDVEARSLLRSACRNYCRTLKSDPAYIDKTIHIADPESLAVEKKIKHLVSPKSQDIRKYKDFDEFLKKYEDNSA